jgi:hypothetical protein
VAGAAIGDWRPRQRLAIGDWRLVILSLPPGDRRLSQRLRDRGIPEANGRDEQTNRPSPIANRASSWFPLIDRNPQVFTDIMHAKESDFHKATIRVYRNPKAPSHLKLHVIEKPGHEPSKDAPEIAREARVGRVGSECAEIDDDARIEHE